MKYSTAGSSWAAAFIAHIQNRCRRAKFIAGIVVMPTTRGLHSFPLPLNLSLLFPAPLNLTPYDPN